MLLTPGLLTMAALVILILKLRTDTVRKLLGFDIPLDIGATLLFIWMFAGTYSGMMAAIIAGLAFSLTLMGMKLIMGYKKLAVIHTDDHFIPSIKWVDVEPRIPVFGFRPKARVRIRGGGLWGG